MPGFILGYGEKGPTSGLKPPGMKEAWAPIWNWKFSAEQCYTEYFISVHHRTNCASNI